MPNAKPVPEWLKNRDPEPFDFMPCLDLEEANEWKKLYDAAGIPMVVVTMSLGSISEARVREVCREKGIEFSPLMQQVCDVAAEEAKDHPPSLNAQFAHHGGVDAFMETHGPNRSDDAQGRT